MSYLDFLPGLGAKVLGVGLWQPADEFLLCGVIRWDICQIVPLVQVFPHVVQLLASVAVTNVVVRLRTNRVVHTVPMRRMGNDRRIRPRDRGIAHQWRNASSVQIIPLGKSTKINECRVKINETDGANAARRSFRLSRIGVSAAVAGELARQMNDQWRSCRGLPQRGFCDVILLAQVVAVVTP